MKKMNLITRFLTLFMVIEYMVQSRRCTNSSDGFCREAERTTLLKLKQSFNDPGDKLSSWEGVDCCEWYGVGCDSKTGYVVKLDLRRNFNELLNMSSNNVFDVLEASKLNSSLLELRYLNYLDLSGNNFNESPIPEFLGEMNNLKHINLSYSNFTTGLFPSRFGSLTNLQVLDLSGIDLSGVRNLLPTLNKLHSLSVLSLSWCTLNDSHLSLDYSNLTFSSSLQELHLTSNAFESFPLLLKNMTSLRALVLSYNRFNCSIPMWLTNLKKLEYLDLSWNQFNKVEGGLWRLLSSLCHLKTIDFSFNAFQLTSSESNKNISRGCIGYDLEELYAHDSGFSSRWNLGLNDVLPDELGQFKKLKYIDLSHNELHGSIPNTIENLTALIELHLHGNKLNGTIPDSIGNLPSLKVLHLAHNDLTGTIPTTIGNLLALKELDISFNRLNNVVPDSIRRLVNLETIDLSSNYLTGNISKTHFLNVTKLRVLSLGSNQLTITISHDWIPPFQLKYLLMNSCKMGSVFPRWVGTQKELQRLSLSNASITGPWPTWFQSSLLYALDLSHNEISGHIPHNIPDLLPALSSLQLSNNLLSGTIPSSLCKMKSLEDLEISRNMLSGNIPNCWEDIEYSYLITIKLSFNKLIGVIPRSIGNVSNLQWLQLDNNGLKGDIPSSLRNCESLSALELGKNKLSGNIPTWIGGMRFLHSLGLRNNSFDGYIPKQLCQMKSLQVLDLAYNNFTGNIPSCLGNLTAMTTKPFVGYKFNEDRWAEETLVVMIKGRALEYTKSLQLVVNVDLSCNNLVGVIPPELTRLSALIGLNLSYNHLTGTIPKNIGSLTALQSLDLSNNRLSGCIPFGISLLYSLISLKLSHNNLSGRIPTGNQLQTLSDDPSIYADNPNLCGTPLTKRCAGDEPVHVPDSNEENGDEEEDKYDKVWLYLAITIGYAVGLWTFFGILMFKKKWRYAYFRYVDYAKDWIYVFVVVNARRLMRKLRGVQE